MAWKNFGDISPRSGTLLGRPETFSLDARGFSGEAVVTIPETAVGGDDQVFLLRQGDVFVSRANLASALDVIGASLQGEDIVQPDHHGNPERHAITSEEGMAILFMAAHAYGGIDNVEISELVRIGPPDPQSSAPRFDGAVTAYAAGSSLWAIMRATFDGFDHDPDGTGLTASVLSEVFEDLPREVRSKSDAAGMPALARYTQDDAGNPMLWTAVFRDEEGSWSEPCTGPELEGAAQVTWAGPEDEPFREWWQALRSEETTEPETAPGI